MSILSLFPTRQLLPLCTVSHRTHELILRIIHNRLVAAANIAGHQIILECYHPSAKISTPYFVCEYLSTDSFDIESVSSDLSQPGRLSKLNNLYSHFKPIQPEGERQVWVPHPAGGWLPAPLSAFGNTDSEFVSQKLELESYECFSQLQSVVNLVQKGPTKGLFTNCISIGEGLTRVWRDWLAERAQNLVPLNEGKVEPEEEHKKRLLWSSVKEDIGLRLRVIKTETVIEPGMHHRDEDQDVCYTMQYEELVIRTSQLLLMVEKSLEKQKAHEGLLCGLDGVFMSGIYKGRMVEESREMYWKPVIDAYAGRPHEPLPVLIGW
jgi:hypothetical protein